MIDNDPIPYRITNRIWVGSKDSQPASVGMPVEYFKGNFPPLPLEYVQIRTPELLQEVGWPLADTLVHVEYNPLDPPDWNFEELPDFENNQRVADLSELSNYRFEYVLSVPEKESLPLFDRRYKDFGYNPRFKLNRKILTPLRRAAERANHSVSALFARLNALINKVSPN